MLSYLHGYHAGNHADVLKHTILTALLARLAKKDKSLRYIDTHAGAGAYDLSTPAALKNREHDSGIARIWSAAEAPGAVERLLGLVRSYNGDGVLHDYPGSPWLASRFLGAGDDAYLFELHATEHRSLARLFGRDARTKVIAEDGLGGCIGLVPPPQKRALLLIDPAYELADEHRRVLAAVESTQRRFATGVTAIWYPLIDPRWVSRFERALRASTEAPIATYELQVSPQKPARGLIGSGMFVVNPPWLLEEELREALPWLASRLGAHGCGAFRLVSPET